MRAPPLKKPQLPFQTGSLVLFGSIIFLLSARLDGWGHPDLSVPRQLELLPFTILFLTLVTLACLSKVEFTLVPAHWRHALADLPLFRLGITLAVLEQCMAIALFAIEGLYFRGVGYVLSLPALIALVALSALAFGWAGFSTDSVQAHRLLIVSGFVFALGVGYSILNFPLSALRSDMLPLIALSGTNFLSGHFPYTLYALGNGTDYLTYLPLTWMTYLPANLLHIDPRWTNIVLSLSAAAIVYFSVRARHRLHASCLLSAFLLLPYVQFRHDLYVSLQWLLLAATFAFWQRGRWLLAAAALGCGAAASQLFWIIIPFYLLYLLGARDWRSTALAFAVLLAAAAVWILPFLLGSPQQFLFGILGHWGTTWHPGEPLSVRTYNATFWIRLALAHLHLESFRNLQRVQGVALIALFVAALRYRPHTPAAVWGWAAASISLFALTNFAVWPYFYVTALFALLLSLLCTAPEQAAPQ